MNSKFLKWAGCLATMFALAACSSEEMADSTQLPEGKYPITFTATGLEVTPVTRATVDGTWTENDVVAVCLESGSYKETKQYKASTTGSSTTLEGYNAKSMFYWQSTSDSYTVTAWSCFNGYTNTSSPSSLLSVKRDQSVDVDGYQKSDFLYAHGTLSYNGNKSLTFYHQVAKVVVYVIKGDDTPEGMGITGMTTGKLNIKRDPWTAPTKTDEFYGSGGSVSYSDNITPLAFYAEKVTLPNGSKATPMKSYKFLIVPQTVNGGDPLFTITADGYDAPFNYIPTADIEWLPGRVYTYYITIKGSKVTATVSTSIGWTEGSAGAGSTTVGETPVTVDLHDASIYDNDNTYFVPSNASVIIDGGGQMLEKRLFINAGAHVVLKNVILHSPDACVHDIIGVHGDATLILSGTNEIKGSQRGAIVVEKGTLTISGTNNDKLDVTAMNYKGAGCLCAFPGANIIINGGNINAVTEAEYSAGIGTFQDVLVASNTSINITINGGIIYAKGGPNSAGIGSCYKDAAMKGNIVITGGNVTAIGGEEGAGIGAGKEGNYGSIAISGVNTVVYAECGADNGYTIYAIGPGTYDPERGGATREAVNIGYGAVITTKNGGVYGH